MKKILLALLAVAVTAPSAAAAPASCIVAKDAAGDVDVVKAPLRTPGVDLVAARASGTNGLSFQVTLAGDPAPEIYENFGYVMELDDDGTIVELEASLDRDKAPRFTLSIGERVGANGNGTVLWTIHDVHGTVDVKRRTVTATATSRQFPSLRNGRTFTLKRISTTHGYGTTHHGPADLVDDMAQRQFVVGEARCKR